MCMSCGAVGRGRRGQVDDADDGQGPAAMRQRWTE